MYNNPNFNLYPPQATVHECAHTYSHTKPYAISRVCWWNSCSLLLYFFVTPASTLIFNVWILSMILLTALHTYEQVCSYPMDCDCCPQHLCSAACGGCWYTTQKDQYFHSCYRQSFLMPIIFSWLSAFIKSMLPSSIYLDKARHME